MAFIIPLLVAVFLAMNMGGSGTTPAFSVAYGARIIKKGSSLFSSVLLFYWAQVLPVIK